MVSDHAAMEKAPQALTEEQVRLLYMQAPVANATIITIATLFNFILGSRVESGLVGYWVLALYLSATIRLGYWYLHKTRPELLSAKSWRRHYLFGTALAGVSWSLIYPLIYLSNDLLVMIALLILIFGVVGSGVIILSAYLPAFVVYAYPQLLTASVTLLFLDPTTGWMLGLSMLIYLGMTTLFTLNVNRNLRKTIRLQTQNEQLINELSGEVSQRESLIAQRTEELREKNIQLKKEDEERKLAQIALRESEQRLSAIFDSAPAGMVLFDTEFRYQLINNTLAEINDIPAADHIGKTVAEVLPEITDIIYPLFRQILETNQPILNQELTGETPNKPNEISHFNISYFPIPGSMGKPNGIGAVVIDVTERKRTEEALRKSEERFNLAMQGANDGVFDWNLVTNEIYYSPRWKSMLGYADSELQNDFSAWEDLIDPVDREKSWDMLTDYINGQRDNFKLECRMRHKDGHWVDILSRAFLVKNEQDKAVRVVGTHVDISEQKSTEAMIHLLSQTVEQSPVLVEITDTGGRIQYVNSTFERVTGYSAEEVIGRNPSFLTSGLTPENRQQEIWGALHSGQPWTGELQNRKKNGDIYWENAHIAPVFDPSDKVTHYLAVKEDITEKRTQEERILRQAHFDALTGLPNRFLALDRLTQLTKEAKRTGTQVAVLFLDLDGFKRVNDSLGHEAGDRLLVLAADRLLSGVRDGDTVCRLGGDEFIILLSGLTQAVDARPVVMGLISRFREPFTLNGRDLIVTTSIGIAVFPEDGNQPAELLSNADTAMYHSKEQGRNTYHYFTSAMNQNVSRRLALEEQLHGALDRGEFSLNYQPLVDLTSGRITGAEALLRWHNTALGEVSPEEFIPIAEQTGSIDEIGQHVLQQALAWTGAWREIQGDGFKIAVNLSPRQFRNPRLATNIDQALQQAGVPATALELEITEGVLMSGHAYIESTLTTLKELGVNIAMDDFGTGYSSLSYLRSYPFNVLKIDRSFIHDITVDPADRELVNAAILMAHGLGLKVIAEGVETVEQLENLRAMGCETAQGYYFSKPVSPEAFCELIEKVYA